MFACMEELLKSGLINLSALAVLMWPDKSKKNAVSRLHSKMHQNNGNCMTWQDYELVEAALNTKGLSTLKKK